MKTVMNVMKKIVSAVLFILLAVGTAGCGAISPAGDAGAAGNPAQDSGGSEEGPGEAANPAANETDGQDAGAAAGQGSAANNADGPDTGSAGGQGPAESAGAGGATEGNQAPVYRRITAEEAHEMMAQSASYVLLDVRTEEEYREKRIDGATLIPNDEIKSRAAAELPDKGQLILIYCRSGNRSASAAKALVELGYSNVYDFGGIGDWLYGTVSG